MDDIELQTALANDVIGIQSAIHDVQDNSGPVVINDSDWHEYTNNGLLYEVKNDGDLWNSSSNKVELTDRVLFSKIDFILKTTVESTKATTLIHVVAYIPDPAGDIPIGGQGVSPVKQNVAHQETIFFAGYIGQKMLDHGVKFKTKVDDTLNGTVTLTNRQLLIRL